MARNTTVSISDEEKRLLIEATETLYGSTDVPWGLTIAELCERVIDVEED